MAELLTLARMARRIGVTQKWLKQESDAGNVPFLLADKRYLYSVEAVVDVLAKRASQGDHLTDEAKTDTN